MKDNCGANATSCQICVAKCDKVRQGATKCEGRWDAELHTGDVCWSYAQPSSFEGIYWVFNATIIGNRPGWKYASCGWLSHVLAPHRTSSHFAGVLTWYRPYLNAGQVLTRSIDSHTFGIKVFHDVSETSTSG